MADDVAISDGDNKAETYSGDAESVALNESIEIYPKRALPHLDRGAVKAYAASSKQGASLFALVCEKTLVPRLGNLVGFSSINNISMAKLISTGVTYWPLTNEEKYMVVYENNLGAPILKEGINPNFAALGIRYEHAVDSIIAPLVSVLVDLRNADQVHGSIATSNLFDGDDSKLSRVMLGECVSTPASYCQPVLYEPVERALCSPEARGVGGFHDDVYSFGVSLITILRGHPSMVGASDREIIKHKIDIGSFSALIGNDRLTGPVLELLRGTLHDDIGQRWTIEDIESWVDGRRLSPKQGGKKNKAKRPLTYNGSKYSRPQILAVDLTDNLSESVQLIENGGVKKWIIRSLSDPLLDERVDQAFSSARDLGKGPGYWDRLICRVSIALYPSSPISSKGLSFHPYGFGTSLAKYVGEKKDVSGHIDALNQNLVMFWVNMQNDILSDVASVTSRFDAGRNYLQQNNMAFGIERVLYHMCPDAPCYSEKIDRYFVQSAEDLLRALNDIGKNEKMRPLKFIDRHIVSFLLVHERKVIESNIVDINSSDEYRVVLGTLRMLGEMQRKLRVKDLDGITNWLAEYVEPLYERIHDRDERVKVKAKIEKLKDSGDVRKMVDVLDNENEKIRDYNYYRASMVEYNNLVLEKENLKKRLVNKATYGIGIGREWSAVVSGLIAIVVTMALLFIYIVKGDSVF